jgi:hypothetical protein
MRSILLSQQGQWYFNWTNETFRLTHFPSGMNKPSPVGMCTYAQAELAGSLGTHRGCLHAEAVLSACNDARPDPDLARGEKRTFSLGLNDS